MEQGIPFLYELNPAEITSGDRDLAEAVVDLNPLVSMTIQVGTRDVFKIDNQKGICLIFS